MEDIFEIKIPIESNLKEDVITRFSAKQGGKYNIFSHFWECFVWAATIGFLRNERRSLNNPKERIFSLNTMRNGDGEKDAQALICMCIAREGSLEIMKNPEEAINIIAEYANGGFYHIKELIENGENSFNDFEKVKQEIFSRNYNPLEQDRIITQNVEHIVPKEGSGSYSSITEENDETFSETNKATQETSGQNSRVCQRRWSKKEEAELAGYSSHGMTIKQLAQYFGKSEEAIIEKLAQMGNYCK